MPALVDPWVLDELDSSRLRHGIDLENSRWQYRSGENRFYHAEYATDVGERPICLISQLDLFGSRTRKRLLRPNQYAEV